MAFLLVEYFKIYFFLIRYIQLFIFILTTQQVVRAQQDTSSLSLEIDSIFITASTGVGRTQYRIDAITLNENPVQNISSAINEVPGVYMHTGTLNTNRITVRGIGNRSLFSTTKLRAYIDDIPLTNGVGETTVEDFDREILQSVELYKGPGATAYGSGLGGLMLLNTSNRPEDNYIKTQVATGKWGFIKTNQVASVSNETFSLKLLHGYQENSRNSELQFGFEISQEDYNWNIFATEDGVQGDQREQNVEQRNSAQLFAQYRMDLTDQIEMEIGVNANLTS